MSKVAAIQMASGPNVQANIDQAEKFINIAAQQGAELIVLPEHFAIMGMTEMDKVGLAEKNGQGLIRDCLRHKAATAAGADEVGMEDLIKKVQEGFTDFDAAIATPSAMLEVRKIARVLGPRGLMPNPKTGTVTDDTATAVNAVKAGRIDYKLDKNGNVSAAVGKASFSEDKLLANTTALIESVMKAKPASAKGNYIQNVTLAASMCPGVALESSLYTVVTN